jgi:N-acetylglucosaminyl-diphospho-decaprenol L-rhamnosyltransferase
MTAERGQATTGEGENLRTQASPDASRAKPDVSILIVNWNGRKVLRNCLQSLREQEGLTSEVIVVDNNSTDGSPDLIPADFPEVVLIRNGTNRGFAAANNQAAERAAGRYLFFLNNDTVAPRETLARLVTFLDEHPEDAALGPKLIGSDGLPQRSGRNAITLRAILHQSVLPVRWTGLFSRQYRAYRHSFNAEQSGPVPQLAAAALVVRREAFFQCGKWDEQFPFGVEDVDLCVRLAPFGSIYYLAEVSITHLGRISSHLNRGWVLQGYLRGYVRYFKKHHRSKWAPLIYKIGVTIDAPIRLLLLIFKAFIGYVTGNSGAVQKLWFFLTRGLLQFWRA